MNRLGVDRRVLFSFDKYNDAGDFVSPASLCRFLLSVQLFFATVAVAAHELVNATSGVDEFLLAGEEGVRGAGDFKLH